MGTFEEQYIYPFIEGKAKLYLRYIDDTFILWTETKQQFDNFLSELNEKHNSIKFDYEMSTTEITFLDTIVYIDNKNHLQTRLHQKPTDRHNYLHRASEHPLPLNDNLAYSQALRIREFCSITRNMKIAPNDLLNLSHHEDTLRTLLENK